MIGGPQVGDAAVLDLRHVSVAPPQDPVGPRWDTLLRRAVVDVAVLVELVRREEINGSFEEPGEDGAFAHLPGELLVGHHHLQHAMTKQRVDHAAAALDPVVQVAEPEHDVERVGGQAAVPAGQGQLLVDGVVVAVALLHGAVVRMEMAVDEGDRCRAEPCGDADPALVADDVPDARRHTRGRQVGDDGEQAFPNEDDQVDGVQRGALQQGHIRAQVLR